jgi:ribosomal protein S18 acetylase RimI-like enzyme
MVTTATGTGLLVRDAVEADQQKLANLLHFELRIHRHLDWHAPLDWLGSSPFVVAESNGRLVGALAFPEDPPGAAWLQVFAAASGKPVREIWEPLWVRAFAMLEDSGKRLTLAAIPMQDWLVNLLKLSGFKLTHEVVMLVWKYDQPLEHLSPLPYPIRPMLSSDLDQVRRVDELAFRDLWQNSRASLEKAFNQAAIATVVEDQTGILGYQISTLSHMGGHLARLAVLPTYQGRRIGYALVHDLLRQFIGRGTLRVTVNTQGDNLVSLSLYDKMGFLRTGEVYPVYEYLRPNDIRIIPSAA